MTWTTEPAHPGLALFTPHLQKCCYEIREPSLHSVARNDPVNSPAHYTDGKIEVIEYIEDKNLDFCLGNAVKYISRAGKKDPTKTVEDLKKAIWYLQRKISQVETNK